MANCRFEDNYMDFGFGNKVNVPIMKCDPPATNAVWGLQASQPIKAVIDVVSSNPSAMKIGQAQSLGGCNPGETDTGLTCVEPVKCTQPTYNFLDPMSMWPKCTGGTARAKALGCKPGQQLIAGLCYD